jgi:hypothetical protein
LFFFFLTEEGSSLDEIDFNWGEYLEETGARAAPHTSFKHVRKAHLIIPLICDGKGRGSVGQSPRTSWKKGKRQFC